VTHPHPRLDLYDTTMPRVRLSAEVTPGGEVNIWIRDESIPAAVLAAGIILHPDQEADLLAWLDEIKERTS